MEIPDPKANQGDIVEVLNYRCRPPKPDNGRVVAPSYKKRSGDFYWAYEIGVNREKSAYRLYVTDKDILFNYSTNITKRD